MNKISDECNKQKSSEVHIEDRGGEKHYKSSDGTWLLLQGHNTISIHIIIIFSIYT